MMGGPNVGERNGRMRLVCSDKLSGGPGTRRAQEGEDVAHDPDGAVAARGASPASHDAYRRLCKEKHLKLS